MTKTHSTELAAATTAQYFDGLLAISTIYFKGTAEVSELALATAHEAVDECLSAAKVAVVAPSRHDVAALRACLGPPMLAKIAEASTRCCEIVARSQRDAARALVTRFPAPFMPMLMTAGIDAAMETFGVGIDRFSTMSAAAAGATDSLFGIGEKMSPQSRKAA